MDLSSLQFLFLFLPIFLVIYLAARKEARLWLIVLGSVAFLAWGQNKIVLWLAGVLLATYGIGLLLPQAREKKRSFWLWAGIGANLILLLGFKILSAYDLHALHLPLIPSEWLPTNVAVPLGLSFVAFQAISYLADVWRGMIPPEKNLLRFGAYLFFFPKLVSGPLVRYKPFAQQLDTLEPSADDIAAGIRRLLIGFIKRTLIANQVALVANSVFNLPQASLVSPQFAWLGLLAYTLQIYFDFSGYTDMAIGLGRMAGFQFPENFNFPYISQSVSEFWRRWHMTLSVWFREYVFFPLERRRFKWMGQQINILIVFLLTGLWHGVKPTFIVWGLLYGIFLALESLGFGRWLSKTWQPIRHIYTLTVVTAGWVFFRSNDLEFALGFFRRLAGDSSGLTLLPLSQTTPLPFIEPSFLLALAAGILFSLPLSAFFEKWRGGFEQGRPWTYFVFQVGADLLLAAVFILGVASVLSQGFLPNIYASF